MEKNNHNSRNLNIFLFCCYSHLVFKDGNVLHFIIFSIFYIFGFTLFSQCPECPQELLNQQQNCKRCLSVIERNHHTLQRALSTSKVLRNFDLSLLQKRVAEIQGSAQVSVIQKCTCIHTRMSHRDSISQNAEYINEMTRTSKQPGGNRADKTHSCVSLFTCFV